jgi:hypothetical protein
MMGCSLCLLVVLVATVVTYGLQPGDRVSTLSQSMHVEMKSPWMDMPLHQMPRFEVPDKHIFYAQLPKHKNATGYRVDPRHDVKVSLTFMGNRMSIPWVNVFNAKERVTLKSLVVTFTHDEFEIVRLRYDTVCKLSTRPSALLSPLYPCIPSAATRTPRSHTSTPTPPNPLPPT